MPTKNTRTKHKKHALKKIKTPRTPQSKNPQKKIAPKNAKQSGTAIETYFKDIVKERLETSVFITSIYKNKIIEVVIDKFKEIIKSHNEDQNRLAVIYGGTSWNHNFKDVANENPDTTFKSAFIEGNYDVFFKINGLNETYNRELSSKIRQMLNILKFRINYILFKQGYKWCKCNYDYDLNEKGTILEECSRNRLILENKLETEPHFPSPTEIVELKQNEFYDNEIDEMILLNFEKRNPPKNNERSICNTKFLFYVEIGTSDTIIDAEFRKYFMDDIYLNKEGCFVLQLFLSKDRETKGLNIDNIRREVCINSIVANQPEFKTKLMIPFEKSFVIQNNDVYHKLLFFGFDRFNAMTPMGNFKTFLTKLNEYIVEENYVSMRQYANALFICINQYLMDNQFGFLVKSGGECIRYYVNDPTMQTKDFDSKIFLYSNTSPETLRTIKNKLMFINLFTSVYLNHYKVLNTINSDFEIIFADETYNMKFLSQRQENMFSSRVLLDFFVPLFSVDTRILYNITKNTTVNETVQMDTIFKNYINETPIDIVIDKHKIKPNEIYSILEKRNPLLPPIATLSFLTNDLETTINTPILFMQRKFTGKSEKDKTRLKALQLVNTTDDFTFRDKLDIMPNTDLHLKEVLTHLLLFDTDNILEYNSNKSFKFNRFFHSIYSIFKTKPNMFVGVFTAMVKTMSMFKQFNEKIGKERYNTPYSEELLNGLSDDQMKMFLLRLNYEELQTPRKGLKVETILNKFEENKINRRNETIKKRRKNINLHRTRKNTLIPYTNLTPKTPYSMVNSKSRVI